MNYKEYETEDFLEDEFFVEWVLNPTVETEHFWENWISANREKLKEIEEAKELICAIKYEKENQIPEKEYSSLFEIILRENHKKNNRFFIWLPKHTYRVAASVLLLLTFAFFYIWKSEPKEEVLFHTISTNYGQKKTITLPDGSKVKLNSGSIVSYSDKFGETKRELALDGEAYFDVSKDIEKPFIIKTHSLTTTVLGTSFSIRNYSEDNQISVAVITGKVALNDNKGNQEVLRSSDLGIFHKQDMTLEKSHFLPDEYLGWIEGYLYFNNEPLPVIFQRLEKWYGVTIVVDDGLNLPGRYSGKYQNRSLETVLEGISFTSQFEFIINDKKVKIYEKQNE